MHRTAMEAGVTEDPWVSPIAQPRSRQDGAAVALGSRYLSGMWSHGWWVLLRQSWGRDRQPWGSQMCPGPWELQGGQAGAVRSAGPRQQGLFLSKENSFEQDNAITCLAWGARGRKPPGSFRACFWWLSNTQESGLSSLGCMDLGSPAKCLPCCGIQTWPFCPPH